MIKGFIEASLLSKKIVLLFELCQNQLSLQRQYDYSLRSIKSLLMTAGDLRRKSPATEETVIIL